MEIDKTVLIVLIVALTICYLVRSGYGKDLVKVTDSFAAVVAAWNGKETHLDDHNGVAAPTINQEKSLQIK